MREIRMSTPELMLVVATRVMLGAGIGLLTARKLSREARLAVGGTLLGIGVLSTIPLAFEVLGRDRRIASSDPRRASA
jgi:hypothetical protein